MNILFTPSARRQFLEAIEYIHRDNPAAASDFRKKAEKSLSRLQKFPESGRLLPEFPELPFREVVGTAHPTRRCCQTWQLIVQLTVL